MKTDEIITRTSQLCASYSNVDEDKILLAIISYESNKQIADAIHRHADVMIDINRSMTSLVATLDQRL